METRHFLLIGKRPQMNEEKEIFIRMIKLGNFDKIRCLLLEMQEIVEEELDQMLQCRTTDEKNEFLELFREQNLKLLYIQVEILFKKRLILQGNIYVDLLKKKIGYRIANFITDKEIKNSIGI